MRWSKVAEAQTKPEARSFGWAGKRLCAHQTLMRRRFSLRISGPSLI